MSSEYPDQKDPIRLAQVRAHVHAVDLVVMRTGLTNLEQIEVCVKAAALAFRRLLTAGLVAGRPLERSERVRLRKSMVVDFDASITRYTEGQQSKEPSGGGPLHGN